MTAPTIIDLILWRDGSKNRRHPVLTEAFTMDCVAAVRAIRDAERRGEGSDRRARITAALQLVLKAYPDLKLLPSAGKDKGAVVTFPRSPAADAEEP